MADYSDLIKKYSAKYGVPEKLIQQVINVESSGKADAVSKTGPVGLMQVSSAVAKEAGYSKSDMYDPEKNIDAGVKYLASNLKAFKGNVPNALLGYNQGTGGARQMLSGKKPMAQEGYNYMRNKKFSPEYIAKDASVPVPTQAPASTEIVN
ncbi:UNVERIFIED_CONTAM: lytic transglycosylase domain-containing protein, partial [Kocuria sp. CPCC 205274]